MSDAVYEIHEGDARNVLCEAVEKHHADMLVVGSHGYGAIKRFVSSFFPFSFQNGGNFVRCYGPSGYIYTAHR